MSPQRKQGSRPLLALRAHLNRKELLVLAHKLKGAKALVAVEVGDGKRRRRRQLGPLEAGRIVIAAKRKEPGVSRLRFAAGLLECRPGNPALDGPAFVFVLPVVEGAAQLDGRLHA